MKRLLVMAGALPLFLVVPASFAANDEAISPPEGKPAAVQEEKAAENAHCDHEGHHHVDGKAAASKASADDAAAVAEPRREPRPSNVSRKHHHRR